MSESSSIPPVPPVPSNPYDAPQSEIITNNPLSGEPATPLNRFAAQFIDGLILLPINFLLMRFLLKPDQDAVNAAVARGDVAGAMSAATPPVYLSLLMSLIGVAILIAINWKFLPNGQTIGKKVMKLQIRSRDGSLLPVKTLLAKRMLPLYVAGSIPVIGVIIVLVDALCIFRKERNTLHDDLAGSKVVVL